MKIRRLQILQKHENKRTNKERGILASYGQTIDFTNKKMLGPIIQYCLQKGN
jgi:hypothetical protein